MLGLASDAAVEGSVRLGELDLRSLDEDAWRSVRSKRISMSFQSTTALNPVLRCGLQVAEPLRVHLGKSQDASARRTDELLTDVGLGPWAAERYPSELSGGQRRLVLRTRTGRPRVGVPAGEQRPSPLVRVPTSPCGRERRVAGTVRAGSPPRDPR